jgi:hypothetical protein
VIEIEFYPEFWEERETWADAVNRALVTFLYQLQKNPDSPNIRPCVDRWGRCSIEFTEEHIVIWRVLRERSQVKSVWAYRPILIRILGVEPTRSPDRRRTAAD